MRLVTSTLAVLLATLTLSNSFTVGRPIRRAASSSSFKVVPRAGGLGGTSLQQSTIANISGGEKIVSEPPPVDIAAIGKYAVATTVQMSLIFGVLTGIDMLVAKFSLKIPFYAKVAFFYLFNLKTSMFSLLPQVNEKISKQQDWEYQRRKNPSWTPPGYVFALMWPLFVFGTRAATAAMIVAKEGSFANSAVMSLMFHLGVANLWNTINNVEKRLGTSVIILYGLWLSKAYAAWRFFQVDQLAGKLLALTLTWLTAAAALETRTWQLNPNPDTGKKEPLYPARSGKWKTRFRWEQ